MNEKTPQEEIDNMLNQNSSEEPEAEKTLNPEDIDTVGEVGNIYLNFSSLRA